MAWETQPKTWVLPTVDAMLKVFVVMSTLLLVVLYVFSFLNPPQERYVVVLLDGEPVRNGENLVVPLKTIVNTDKPLKIFFTAKLGGEKIGERVVDVDREDKKVFSLVANLGGATIPEKGSLVVEFVITSWEGENLGEGKLVKHLST